jgi:hypothetical protein
MRAHTEAGDGAEKDGCVVCHHIHVVDLVLVLALHQEAGEEARETGGLPPRGELWKLQAIQYTIVEGNGPKPKGNGR